MAGRPVNPFSVYAPSLWLGFLSLLFVLSIGLRARLMASSDYLYHVHEAYRYYGVLLFFANTLLPVLLFTCALVVSLGAKNVINRVAGKSGVLVVGLLSVLCAAHAMSGRVHEYFSNLKRYPFGWDLYATTFVLGSLSMLVLGGLITVYPRFSRTVFQRVLLGVLSILAIVCLALGSLWVNMVWGYQE